jgi:rhamnosyltransferase
MRASIIIRCLNEARHLPRLLTGLHRQSLAPHEVVVVDSGSTDGTVEVAERGGARIVRIAPSEFSFGRSLNRGAAAATGDFLVVVSAHTYPVSDQWLERLLTPFSDPRTALVYGSQRGDERTKFSEHRIFQQWFPDESCDDQRHPFCNNANAAVRRDRWEEIPYDEEIAGLEDIHWAKQALGRGWRVVYRADAAVVHVHEETYAQIHRRYRREAMALSVISPAERMSLGHGLSLLTHAIGGDLAEAWRQGMLSRAAASIVAFRIAQYAGAYRGLRWRGDVTDELRARLYYPRHYRAARRSRRPAASVADSPETVR